MGRWADRSIWALLGRRDGDYLRRADPRVDMVVGVASFSSLEEIVGIVARRWTPFKSRIENGVWIGEILSAAEEVDGFEIRRLWVYPRNLERTIGRLDQSRADRRRASRHYQRRQQQERPITFSIPI